MDGSRPQEMYDNDNVAPEKCIQKVGNARTPRQNLGFTSTRQEVKFHACGLLKKTSINCYLNDF